jgi:hypothetical protein
MSGGQGARKRREARRYSALRRLLARSHAELQDLIDYADTTWEEGASDEVDPCPGARTLLREIEDAIPEALAQDQRVPDAGYSSERTGNHP